MTWLADLKRLADAGESAVLVTVTAARGSTPREAGTKMVVTRDRFFGTIGGGHLEYRCLEIAREILGAEPVARIRRFEVFPLGPALGQCCGGAADVLFEAVAAQDLLEIDPSNAETPSVLVTPLATEGGAMYLRSGYPADDLEQMPCVTSEGGRAVLIERVCDDRTQVLLFGAGHVGQAVVAALAPLPFAVSWIDSRADSFPPEMPSNTVIEVVDRPTLEVDYTLPGAFYLVMTHSHQLDLEICEAVLRRGDFAYLGLIGSATKRARFNRRLLAKGLPADRLGRLTCPIGIAGISGKHPAEIAASVSAQLLAEREAQSLFEAREAPDRDGLKRNISGQGS
ncbi:xanthine dehydrogenase accessory protein XdhC [Pelagibius sp. Alg239-R121]|uniref:xanthine dehydrogenase accessory protein XdhC n=1 Tax=Pelagibius sp. Alg239-R121 TaxID=2993448 RepID=UPI0024A6BF34|nr:xanthine dehydrogenase accessory protein XdhC [Pelagibius sp. Alg239-R121]